MKSSYFLSVGALVLGMVGGYVAGKGGSERGEGGQDEGLAASRTRSVEREAGGSRDGAGKRVARTTDTGEIVNLPGSTARVQSLMDFYGSLSPERLEEEAGKLDELPANERILASFLLFGRWGESDPVAAMNFAKTMGFTGMFVRPTVLQSWASVDPVNAARYYQDNPREFAMMGAMGGGRGPMGGVAGAAVIAGEWAKQDPTAALAWASSLPREKSQAIQSVISQMANTDPKGAAEMLAKLPAEDLSDSYESVAARYGAKDFGEASAWVRSLPVEEQSAAMAAAIRGLSKQDPAAAALELGKMPEGEEKDQAVSGVVENLARVDPVAASELLKKQTSEGALRESMRELMPTWVSKDPAAALQFANSYDAGPIRDSAIQSYVWSHSEGSPAELIEVAESIQDEGDRYRTVGMAAMRWMREDEEAAKAYLEKSDSLPDDAKTRIMEGRGFWGGRGGRR